jgi:hypothetical protein
MRNFLTSIVIGLIVSIIIICLAWLYNKSKSPVIVLPNKIDLTTKKYNRTSVFEIKNKDAERTFYAIWVKLWGNRIDLDFKDIEIATEKGDPFISQELVGVFVNFDLVKIFAFDSKRKPCIYLLLYKLKNKESRLFKVTKHRSKKNVREPFELLLELKDFSKIPPSLASRNDKAALMFQPPEDLTIKSISFRLRKKT